MVLVLCIGDLHIPHRAADMPHKFKELLKPGKIHSILCTGNVCTKTFFDHLKTISKDLNVVQGDFDGFTAPEHLVKEIGEFKIGLCHGHQVVPTGDMDALKILQRQLDVDILVTGHTHGYKASKQGSCLFINPGSATGAYSTTEDAGKPSFVLMDLDGPKATVYVYQLVDGDVKVEKFEFTKSSESSGGL